jgi:hypothetical protein
MSLDEPLRTVDDPTIPTLQASKWLQQQMLLGASEMEGLFKHMGEFSIVKVGAIVSLDEAIVSSDTFLKEYQGYTEALMKGELPDILAFRRLFSVVITSSLDALFACCVGPDQYVIKVTKPIIQVQAHAMHYSTDDNKFRPMVFGPDCITWGIQFSYPQIYQDPTSMMIEKVSDQDRCPNTLLFRAIQQWQRQNTLPTPFFVDDKKVNVPMRIGKKCLSWVNKHPQLISQKIQVIANERK